MNSQFYAALPTFKQFEDFIDHSHYQPLPEDWYLFITDIKGSTQAIEAGLYKEVNLIGAASITLAIQTIGELEFPFVFGGDGASLCIPAAEQEKVSLELSKLIVMAKENFNLELRVAKIPASVIYEAGKEILVSKLEITEDRCISLFRGGGLAHADNLAKQHYEDYQVETASQSVESLTGLSCRWSPIPAKKGVIVSMLVMAKDEGAVDVYRKVLGNIRGILNSSIEEANPIAVDHVKYKSFSDAIKEEVKYCKRVLSFSFLKRLFDILFSVLIFRYHINPFFFDTKKYADSISFHSDFRKFDDTLRLIIDCDENAYLALQDTLEKAYLDGQIYYGLFTSKEVLMTCFVENTDQGKHLHFVDGGDGGLAMAAKQLKAQLAPELATV